MQKDKFTINVFLCPSSCFLYSFAFVCLALFSQTTKNNEMQSVLKAKFKTERHYAHSSLLWLNMEKHRCVGKLDKESLAAQQPLSNQVCEGSLSKQEVQGIEDLLDLWWWSHFV